MTEHGQFQEEETIMHFSERKNKNNFKKKKKFHIFVRATSKRRKMFYVLEGQLQGDNFLYFREDQLKEAIFYVFLQGQL